ncbi:MAG: septal ring lytic transglycosylase RlpA family protein [Spirochaetaceae bacterium]|jgi:rare lipoprotein A|nr:septal ring lytic transglycosylase RlpA family protein [Spirochaetaceae bacterium]
MKRITLIFALQLPVLMIFAQSGVRTGEITRGIFHQEGIASWYGEEFNGRPTASGEIFDDTKLTAAHPVLPFGTMLKITNNHNNKSVVVRVNDRGPFVAERILDLSRTAALQLDMISTGTAPVSVESLHEVSLPARNTPPGTGTAAAQAAPAASPAQAVPAQTAVQSPAELSTGPAALPAGQMPVQAGEAVQIRPASVEPYSNRNPPGLSQPIDPGPRAGGTFTQTGTAAVQLTGRVSGMDSSKRYRIQVGAYTQPRNAVEAFEKLKNAGLNPAYERYNEYYRVVLSGIKNTEVQSVAETLGRAGFREAIIKEE